MQPYSNVKLLVLNSAVFILSLTQIETFLRFTLLIISIIYTGYKIIDRFDEKKQKHKS